MTYISESRQSGSQSTDGIVSLDFFQQLHEYLTLTVVDHTLKPKTSIAGVFYDRQNVGNSRARPGSGSPRRPFLCWPRNGRTF